MCCYTVVVAQWTWLLTNSWLKGAVVRVVVIRGLRIWLDILRDALRAHLVATDFFLFFPKPPREWQVILWVMNQSPTNLDRETPGLGLACLRWWQPAADPTVIGVRQWITPPFLNQSIRHARSNRIFYYFIWWQRWPLVSSLSVSKQKSEFFFSSLSGS